MPLSCFDSLQAGRTFPTLYRVSIPFALDGVRSLCFNSLQTGRTFPTEGTGGIRRLLVRREVSIPFKREGLSQLYPEIIRKANRIALVFQFPSNGKDFPNLIGGQPRPGLVLAVSIPVEGLSQRYEGLQLPKCSKKFQFPSNGKDFPNKRLNIRARNELFQSNGQDFHNL